LWSRFVIPGPERREKAFVPATDRAGCVEYLLPIVPDSLVDAEEGFSKFGPRLWTVSHFQYSYCSNCETKNKMSTFEKNPTKSRE
jgi:hypothetical protein